MIHLVKEYEKYKDEEIINSILTGETKLYEIIIRRYNPYLYKIGRTYNYNHQDTEDLMQDTFISAFYNLSKFEKRSTFMTWLTRIMLNKCYHKKHKFSYKNEIPSDEGLMDKTKPMFQQNTGSEKKLINKELGSIIESGLRNIPEDYRIVFTLRELNGMSVAETSEAANISISNVKVRLNRAKEMLRSEISKMYRPEDIFEFNLVYCDNIVDKVMSHIIAGPVPETG